MPDTKKALDLWNWVAFDPTPAWAFTYLWEKQRSVRHGGRITGQRRFPQQTKDELDTWVLIRHKIAHGDAIPAEPRFQALATGQRNGVPRLKRIDADRCLTFFQQLVAVTGGRGLEGVPVAGG